MTRRGVRRGGDPARGVRIRGATRAGIVDNRPVCVATDRGKGGTPALLSEEALIVLAAFGACGLLVLGVVELLWPARPRHPVRRLPPPVLHTPRPHRTSALVRHTLEAGRSPYRRRAARMQPSRHEDQPRASHVSLQSTAT